MLISALILLGRPEPTAPLLHTVLLTNTGSPLGILLVSFRLVQQPDTIKFVLVLCLPQASATILAWDCLDWPCLSILKASLVSNHRSFAQKGLVNIVENYNFIESIEKY